MRPNAVRTLILALVLGAQLITLSTLWTRSHGTAQTIFRAHASSVLAQLAQTVAERTRLYLQPASTAARAGATLIAKEVVAHDADLKLEQFMLAQLRASDSIDNMFFARSDGSFVSMSREGSGFVARNVIIHRDGTREQARFRFSTDGFFLGREVWLQDNFDPRRRPWYEPARAAGGEVVWSDPYPYYHHSVNGLTASLVVLGARGHELGVLGVDVRLDSIESFIASIPIAANGSAALITESGKVVVTSRNLRNPGALRSPSDMNELGDPVLRTLLLGGLAHLRTQHPDGPPIPDLLPFDPTSVAMAGAPPALPESGWVGPFRRPAPGTVTVARTTTPETARRADSPRFMELYVEGRGTHYGIVHAFAPSAGRAPWLLAVEGPVTEFSGGIEEALFGNWLAAGLISLLITGLVTSVIVMLTRPIDDMHRSATTDNLTGLLNRRAFVEELGLASAGLQRQRGLARLPGLGWLAMPSRRRAPAPHWVVAALDLDGFKPVNDTWGHGIGDEVLIEIARRLRTAVAHDGYTGRIGGDEFLFAMPLDTEEQAAAAVEAVRHGCVGQPIAVEEHTLHVGMTAGFVLISGAGSVDDAIRRADVALVHGKARSKNRTYDASVVSAWPPGVGHKFDTTPEAPDTQVH